MTWRGRWLPGTWKDKASLWCGAFVLLAPPIIAALDWAIN